MKPDLFHRCCFGCLGYDRAVKVGALAVIGALELLESAIVFEPLVGEEISAIHAAHRNYHGTSTGLQRFCGVTFTP